MPTNELFRMPAKHIIYYDCGHLRLTMTHEHYPNRCPDNMPKTVVTYDMCNGCFERAKSLSKCMNGFENGDQVPTTDKYPKLVAPDTYDIGDKGVTRRPAIANLRESSSPVQQRVAETGTCHYIGCGYDTSSDEEKTETCSCDDGDSDLSSGEDGIAFMWRSGNESSEETQTSFCDDEDNLSTRPLAHGGCSAKEGCECAECEFKNAIVDERPGQ